MNATDTARQALEVAGAPKAAQTLDTMLVRMRPEIEKALPRAAGGVERFARLVTTELRRTPQLYDCEPVSVLGSMMLCAQLGVEPGPLGHAYLVPYKRECTFVLGYKGMIELANRSGRLRSIVARPVYEGDTFSYRYGIADKLHHEPAPPSERGKTLLFYGLARLANPAGSHLHVMYPEEIEARAKRSPLFRAGKGPWQTDRLAMQLKTVVRAMQPWLPQSVEIARAVEHDERPVLFESGEISAPTREEEGE